MAITGPVLDDRSYEQLRQELIRQIPVYAPEWTNHNESDPGIALVDLFAYLGESLLFRFNQIPEATRLAFLDLLGIQRRPATPASVLVALGTERPGGVHLPEHTELAAGSVPFETDQGVHAWPLTALAAGRYPAADVDDGPVGPDGAPDAAARYERDRRRDVARRLHLDLDTVHFYETRWLPGDPALADGEKPTWTPDAATETLDVRATVDQAFWMALLRRDTTDLAALGGRTVFLGVAFDERIDPPLTLGAGGAGGAGCAPCGGASTGTPATSTAADVERFRATGLDAGAPGVRWQLWRGDGEPATPLRVLGDGTRGLTTTGVVQLELPARLDPPPEADGVGDSPPPLPDDDLAARVVAWLRVSRGEDGSGPVAAPPAIPPLRWVGLNAVPATQARTATPELLGTGSGDAGQRYRLAHPGVLPGSVELDVEDAAGWRRWTEVADFSASGGDAEHYTVDLTAGEVRFGTYCRVPQIGQRIRVRAYRYGGGVAGQVPAGAVNRVPPEPGVTAANPLPATGGADAESVPDALDRIPGEVQRLERAVTADDFSALAADVAGVGRAETLPGFFPEVPNRPAAGVVSVVVLPSADPAAPEAPLPDRELLRRVGAHLDRRRLITTELYVIPPRYRMISVAAGVAVRDGYQIDAIRRWVELILRQFLAPLPPDGPDGAGWPLGRTVRAAELQAVAVQVEGVEYLTGLELGVTPDGGTTWCPVPLVELACWELPHLVGVTVLGGAPLAPGEAYPVSPGTTPTGVRLAPLPREVC